MKEKFDATVFRETVLPILAESEYEDALKFLEKGTVTVDGQPQVLDYRTYADSLFDILICGGTLGKFCPRGAALARCFCVLTCIPPSTSSTPVG